VYNLQISNVGWIFENIDSGILAGLRHGWAVSRRRRGKKIIRLMTIQYRAIIATKGYAGKREREKKYSRAHQIQY